jgi:hypothetical protein
MQGNLQGYINAQDAVDQIRLSLNSPGGRGLVYILVEGKYDCCLYPKFFKECLVSLEYVGGGKGQVEKALTLLQGITKQTFGICDADFRHITGNYSALSNLFLTDYHDIEMMMLNDNQTAANAFVEYRLQGNGIDIVQDAINGSIFAGYARWYNDTNVIELKFKNFSILPYYNISTKVFNQTLFLNELNTRSPNKITAISLSLINDFTRANTTTDFLNLCNGHDVITLIVAMIKITPKNNNVSEEKFTSVLRASYTLNSFKATKLYAAIRAWETANTYNILLK